MCKGRRAWVDEMVQLLIHADQPLVCLPVLSECTPHSYHHTGGPSQRLGFPQQRQAGSSHWWCEVLRST